MVTDQPGTAPRLDSWGAVEEPATDCYSAQRCRLRGLGEANGKAPDPYIHVQGKTAEFGQYSRQDKGTRKSRDTDFRWHDLRHTWATWQRQAGTPTHELQRLGGWRTGAMVERYAHLAPEHLAVAASRLDSLLAGYDLAT